MSETVVASRGLQLSNGDHVCVFCRGGERDELLVALGTGGGGGHQADQLTVLASRDVYLTDRGFDMDGMLDFTGPNCGASPRAGPATTGSARPGR